MAGSLWLRLHPRQAPPQADAHAQEPDDLQDDADEAGDDEAFCRQLEGPESGENAAGYTDPAQEGGRVKEAGSEGGSRAYTP